MLKRYPVSRRSIRNQLMKKNTSSVKKKKKKKKKKKNETDSDTFDPDALYKDEAQWSHLTAEHKLGANTASLSAPRYIDSAPDNVRTVESTFVYAGDGRRVGIHANYRLSHRSRAQNRPHIEEANSGLSKEDKAHFATVSVHR